VGNRASPELLADDGGAFDQGALFGLQPIEAGGK
jgi:hypothetical protein